MAVTLMRRAQTQISRSTKALRERVGVGDLDRIEDLEVVRGALRRSDSGALEERLPDGLGTRVGTRFTAGRELSGGEWAASGSGSRSHAG